MRDLPWWVPTRQTFIGILIIVAIVTIALWLIARPSTPDSDILKLLLGALIGWGGSIVQFDYGSSKGSEKKDDYIMGPTSPSPVARQIDMPEQAQTAPPAARTAPLLALVIGASLMLAMLAQPALAQKRGVELPPLPRLPDIARQNDVNAPGRQLPGAELPDLKPEDVWQKIISSSLADLRYAAAMATAANTNGSKVRLQCINALIDANVQASGANLPKNPDGTAMQMPDPSLVTHIEIMAEIVDNLSPQGPLFTSCAGAAGLFRMQVLQLINGIVTGSVGLAARAALPIP